MAELKGTSKPLKRCWRDVVNSYIPEPAASDKNRASHENGEPTKKISRQQYYVDTLSVSRENDQRKNYLSKLRSHSKSKIDVTLGQSDRSKQPDLTASKDSHVSNTCCKTCESWTCQLDNNFSDGSEVPVFPDAEVVQNRIIKENIFLWEPVGSEND